MPYQAKDVASWSPQEFARVLIVRARIHGSSQLRHPGLSDEEKEKIFVLVYGKAAQECGYPSHEALPERVKSLIGEPGGRAKAYQRDEPDTVGPAVPLEEQLEEEERRLAAHVAPKPLFRLTETQWFRQKVCRHSWWWTELHPE